MATHKIPESQRYRGLAKWFQYWASRCIITVLEYLPICFSCRLGRFVGWVCWKTMPARRGIVQKNLSVVNAWLREDQARVSDLSAFEMPLDEQVKEVFQRSGANLLCGFNFARFSPVQAKKHLEIIGLESLKQALSEEKGAIILLAHMGPWEALNQLPEVARSVNINAPMGAMYRPLNNAYLDEWFKGKREAQGTSLFSRRDGFHKPVDFLRSGGMLGILADQKMREGAKVLYFGEMTPSSPIPGLFQRRSGAPILALSISTLSSSQWQISIQSVVSQGELSARSREDLARLSNSALERSLSKSPLDGFWLHKRF